MKRLINQVARRVQCDRSGSCVVFASELCKQASDGFRVVEGQIKFRGSVAFDHVWIEDAGGATHDPTLLQFGFFNLSTAQYLPGKCYSPAQFARVVRRHPQRDQFSTLLK